ncbi:MAG: GNAT family N-acetyltransferase [Actinobacteria bacterium]|nr:GNAT family N-acetyltransferase [Actinomycetota bacterium]
MDDDLLVRAADNLGGSYRHWAEALGKPARLWEDLSIGDLGLPVTEPVNNASLLQPPTDVSDLVDRIRSFFGANPGGGYEIWSLWPLPEQVPEGFESYRCPAMIREAGGEAPSPPAELEILEVSDADTARAAEGILDAVYGCHSPEAGSLMTPAVSSKDFRTWVGSVDGRPVSTATAYVGGGFVGVYAVATYEEARGRGYGQALTWKATMFRPDLPATLQASPLGLPIYEQMGYRQIAECTVWYTEQR